MSGDPRFHALLKEIGDLHDKKQSDYGTGADPFANVRGSTAWGVKPWVGAMVRANDKIKRLQKYAQDGRLANESAHDSFLDGAVYILIASILHDEENEWDGTQVEDFPPMEVDEFLASLDEISGAVAEPPSAAYPSIPCCEAYCDDCGDDGYCQACRDDCWCKLPDGPEFC